MNPTHYIFCAAVAAFMISCAGPSGMTMREYAAMTEPTKAAPFPSTLIVTLNEPGRPSRSLPSVKIKPDRPFSIADQRELVFPAAYNPAIASGLLTSVKWR
jgi:hypothetical protein